MTRLSVPDMSCGHCKASVEKAIAAVDPQATVSVDLTTRQVTVDASAALSAILSALQDAGYPAKVTA